MNFDYIIVGAGTAGCLLANRLSADPSKRILLLEAGGSDKYHWVQIPVGYLYCIGNPRTDWMFNTERELGLGGRTIRYPRGRVMGGCSSINGMIYMRGQAADYDAWAALGNEGWSWADVLPYFLKHEDHFSGDSSEMHRSGGEWRVERQRLRWDLLDAWRDAADQIGIRKIDDFNLGDNSGCAYFEVNQKAGIRWNASRGFLDPIRQRSNLTIISQAQVQGLEFAHEPDADGRPRVVGVRFSKNGSQLALVDPARAGEVILAAGAIGSPQLLELSGIGRADVLSRAGVALKVSERGVGENLQDHLQLRTIYRVSNVQTLNTLANSWLGKLKIAFEYAMHRTGPMSMAPSQLGAFAKSSPDHLRSNIQYHVQPLSLDKFGEPLHSYPAMTASVCNLRPFSRGSTHITSANASKAPSIAPNYLSDSRDLIVAADSIRVTRRVMSAPALAPFAPVEYLPGAQLETDEQLQNAARQIGTTIFHPVGTVRMGVESDRGTVVNSKGQLHRVAGLRVADASIMPLITSGNTNSPTLMIAERIAEFIRGGV